MKDSGYSLRRSYWRARHSARDSTLSSDESKFVLACPTLHTAYVHVQNVQYGSEPQNVTVTWAYMYCSDPIQGVAKTWTAQAKTEAAWAKLTNTWRGNQTQDPQSKKQR